MTRTPGGPRTRRPSEQAPAAGRPVLSSVRLPGALVVVLSALTWVFFKIATPNAPLDAPATIVVVAIWTGVVSGGTWLWHASRR